jgi:hypothetical protein
LKSLHHNHHNHASDETDEIAAPAARSEIPNTFTVTPSPYDCLEMVVRSFPKYAPANAGGIPTTVPVINDSGQRLAESGLTTKYPMSAAGKPSPPPGATLFATWFTKSAIYQIA